MFVFICLSLGTGRLGERKEHLLPRLNSVLQSRPMPDYMEITRFIVFFIGGMMCLVLDIA